MENTTPEVYAAINRVAKTLAKHGIGKDSRNQQQGFNFRGIDAVHCTLGPILAAEGLVILPRVTNRQQTERTTAKGGVLFSVTVDVDYDIVSMADGSTHSARFIGEGMDSGDKATNKAMSAAYKYMAIQTFCIPTHGNDDADFETHEVVKQGVDPQPKRNEAKAKAEAAIVAHPDAMQVAEIAAWVGAAMEDGAYPDVKNYFAQIDAEAKGK